MASGHEQKLSRRSDDGVRDGSLSILLYFSTSSWLLNKRRIWHGENKTAGVAGAQAQRAPRIITICGVRIRFVHETCAHNMKNALGLKIESWRRATMASAMPCLWVPAYLLSPATFAACLPLLPLSIPISSSSSLCFAVPLFCLVPSQSARMTYAGIKNK